jgi:acyl-CoA synthetase (AMP-forming)/AMP-acid ligase II/acyl carrier protein
VTAGPPVPRIERIDRTAPHPLRVVPDLLRRSAGLVPDRVAIADDGGGQLTFEELLRRSDAVARGLRDRGVARGDRVALLFGQDSWLDYAVAYFAALTAGATALIVGDRFTDDDLTDMARRHRIVGAVGSRRCPADLTGCWTASVGELEKGGPDTGTPVDALPDDAAEVIFTSGTTSRPRAVEATHANLMRAQTAWPTGVRANQPCVHALPIGTVAAQVLLLTCVGSQNTLVVMSRFDVGGFSCLVGRWQATTACLVPTMGHWLVRAAPGQVTPMPSVRGVSFSGAALPVGIMKDLPPVFPRAAFHNFYTSTETYPARLSTTYDPARPESVGRPAGSCEVRITSPDGTPLPDGEVGQVWLRARGAPSRRFMDGDEETAAEATFRDGWTRTGDLGRLDADGHLCLAGRESDIVIVGGFNVSTHRVESVLCLYEAVAEAAAFGVDHPVLGEIVAAFVVLREDATVREVRAHAAGHLTRREQPAIIRIVDDIPHNAAGKIDKRALPALLDAPGPAGFQAPRTDTEKAIAAVWADVLGLGSVGVDDNFFEIGGDSLTATQIAATLRQGLGVDIDSVAVFEAPTVAELADQLDGRSDPASW